MTSCLEGSKLKVMRAREHLNALKRDVANYLNMEPYQFVLQHHRDGCTVYPEVSTRPPRLLSVIIGDCVGNLRSALDYIVWELANRFHSKSLNPERDKVYFPIYKTDHTGKFAEHRKKLEQYQIPPAVLDEIENV